MSLAENSEIEALFPVESLGTIMAKVSALEAFLNLGIRDCKFSEFMHEVLSAIMKSIRCEAGSILEINQDDNTVFFRASIGQGSQNLDDVIIPAGAGIVGHVIESRGTAVIQNVKEEKQHLNALAGAVGFEVRNLVAVPVIVRGQIFGVIELLNRVGESEFSSDDIRLINYLVEVAAKAVEVRMMLLWAQKKKDLHG